MNDLLTLPFRTVDFCRVIITIRKPVESKLIRKGPSKCIIERLNANVCHCTELNFVTHQVYRPSRGSSIR